MSWIVYDANTHSLHRDQLVADAVLVNGSENAYEINVENLSLLKQGSRRLVAVFPTSLIEADSARLLVPFEWQGKLVQKFLSRALPISLQDLKFEIVTGNFDQHIELFTSGNSQILIAPLDDLILYDQDFLGARKYMILPLFECPPALMQGVLALKNVTDERLKEHLRQIGEDTTSLQKAIQLSAAYPETQHGVIHLDLPLISFTFLNGFNSGGQSFDNWEMPEPPEAWEEKRFFASTEFMKDFFRYEYFSPADAGGSEATFVASHKAIHDAALESKLRLVKLWAAGTKTWFELAKKDLWVNGSADGIGMETLAEVWSLPGISISKQNLEILTNTESATTWQEEGWNAFGTYELVPSFSTNLKDELSHAEVVFWTSYQQYKEGSQYVSADVIHATPAGKTAQLLAGKHPFIFPSIRAFNWWWKRKK
ncbi:MAG: hypothetical protein ABW036_01690 [Flavitalea sp.]